MNDTKKWWQSKGVIGSIVSILALGARFLGYDIDPTAEQQIALIVLEAIAAAGALLALIGRIVADKRIG
jgi:hypothetical protein